MEPVNESGESWNRFDCAACGERDFFDLVKDYLSTYNDLDAKPCKHAYDIQTEEHDMYGGQKYRKQRWRWPWAVGGWNQGGHDCVFICLECAIEARSTLSRGG